jgi:glycosyltransferase involved in cell wall biosynthesis
MTRVLHMQRVKAIGGSERHLLDLLPALTERGHEVAMVAIVAPGGQPWVDALRERGVETITLPAGPDLNPMDVVRLVREIRRWKPDLVHTHLIHADFHGQVAAQLARVPAIMSVHGSHPFYFRQPGKVAATAAGRAARLTIAISEFVGRMLTETKIVKPERVRVVYYGIRAELWAPDPADRSEARAEFGVGDDDVVVGVASRLYPEKGHDTLIRAVAVARRNGCDLRLFVAGQGELREELEALARSEGLGDAVRFLGFVPNVRRFMGGCDMIAFPTTPRFGEGFGLAALEAQAAGCPVVATRVDSLPEVVADGETGVLVPPDNVEALAGALTELAGDPGRRRQMGTNGQERAVKAFSFDAMIDGTIKVYEEALG